MSILSEIMETTRAGDQQKAAALAKQAIEQGVEPDRIIKEALIPAMEVVGKEFGEGKIYIPEMLIAARAMKTALETLKPLLVGEQMESFAKIVLGTVQGDMHDIGKNLVAMMLEGAGIEVIDLGVDVPPARFIAAIKEHKPQFLGMSALLTTTMATMKETVEALEKEGLRKGVKILIGGAPVTQAFADEIGADGYGANASEAVNRLKALAA